MDRPTIVVVGSGNVATHLAKALDRCADVVQVVSRDINHAQTLAQQLSNADYTDSVDLIWADADYYLISVNDDTIAKVAMQMPSMHGVVMHTSGSVDIGALSPAQRQTGVLYPLQTFSKYAQVDVSAVPFFIEASDMHTLGRIEDLARMISNNVYYADSAQRTVLHIAAVFGCNFFNHLLAISSDILANKGYTLQVLRPLLEVTLDKAMSIGAHAAQTGPAARHDIGVIERHLNALDPDKREIYRLLSDSIMRG